MVEDQKQQIASHLQRIEMLRKELDLKEKESPKSLLTAALQDHLNFVRRDRTDVEIRERHGARYGAINDSTPLKVSSDKRAEAS